MTPQEKETKLREAAKFEVSPRRTPLNIWLDGAKSEAAREYHQQVKMDEVLPNNITVEQLLRACFHYESDEAYNKLLSFPDKQQIITFAEQYHKLRQQEPKEVDVETLKKEFNHKSRFIRPDIAKQFWDFFQPHLQPKQESDLVDTADFSMWLMLNFVQLWDKERRRYSYVDKRNTVYTHGSEHHYARVCKEHGISMEQAINEFKQSKTNSDEK